MKRKLLISLSAVFGLGLVVSAAFGGVVHATDIRTGDKPTLDSSEVTDSSLYAAGNSVVVGGTVKGDLFCAGANIDITGTVEGDVICAGQTVRIAGKVLGDVRVAGQSVEITSEVQGSVTAMAESVVLSPESKIGRDVTLGGNRVQLEGAIGRDVLGAAEVLNISGTIGRSVDAEVSSLTIDSKARIGSDLNYRSTSRAAIAEGAVIAGETRYTERSRDQEENMASARFYGAMYGFVAMLMIGLAALLVSPRGFDAVSAPVRNRGVLAFATGAATLIALPIVGIVLLSSVFGIPLAILLFLLWIAGLIVSYAIAAYALGWFIVEKLGWPNRGRRLTSLLMGLLVMGLVSLIPIVGGVVIFLLMVVGLGALTLACFNRAKAAKTPAKGKA